MDFGDRVAVVTGSARGIGKAIAGHLLAGGASVGIVDLDRDAVDTACSDLAPGDDAGRVAGFTCNVADQGEVETLFRAVKQRFERLDILVNNAGVTDDSLFSRMTLEQWKHVMDVNLTGAFLCARHAVSMLRESKRGRIINLSSIAAKGNIGQANYSASKAGVIGLTKALAIELGRDGVTVNAVAPGFIDTEMTRGVPEKFRQHWFRRIPLGRAGTVDEVAATVAFLASDDAAFITGQVMEVDGGLGSPSEVASSVDSVK